MDKYKEALNSKKRQRNDVSSTERPGGAKLAKMGSHNHRNPQDIVTQRLDDRTKTAGLNKRVRTSVADVVGLYFNINVEYLCIFLRFAKML